MLLWNRTLCHHTRSLGSVLASNHTDILQCREELRALVDGLLMRIDFTDILELCTGHCKDCVVNLQTHTAHNADIVSSKQVIDGIHRTRERVLDWQHTKLAKTAADSLEDALEIAHIHNFGKVEKTLGCKVCI